MEEGTGLNWAQWEALSELVGFTGQMTLPTNGSNEADCLAFCPRVSI